MNDLKEIRIERIWVLAQVLEILHDEPSENFIKDISAGMASCREDLYQFEPTPLGKFADYLWRMIQEFKSRQKLAARQSSAR